MTLENLRANFRGVDSELPPAAELLSRNP